MSSPWPGWDQPTLHNHDLAPDAWEAGRRALPPRPMREGPVEASRLVAEGDCSAQCLVTPEDRAGCACTCRGIYHGVLARTQITAAAVEALHGQ